MQTPLRQVRHLGSARLGAEAAWRQKVTAVALIPLAFAFVWLALDLLSKDYAHARAALGSPIALTATLGFTLTGIFHMQIGMRSIIDDYAHGHAREWALIGNLLFCGLLTLACAVAALRIGLG